MPVRIHPRPLPSALVRAAGALVWRMRDEACDGGRTFSQVIDPRDIEVLVVHRPKYNDWSWPKGKTEQGELLTAAAVREVEEETGYVISLGQPLTVQRYRLGNGHIKEVYYWVGSLAGDSPATRVRVPVERAPRQEIDESRWVSCQEAEKLLTRRGDRRLLTELAALAQSGTLVTRPFVLMRNAQAVDRSQWNGLLSRRHLSREGVRQSFDVVSALSAFGVEDVHASSWMSDHRSVAPYAAAAGVKIHVHEQLTESARDANACVVRECVADLMTQSAVPMVVCVNQRVVPDVLDVLRCESSSEVHVRYPRQAPWLTSGELLIAHLAGQKRPVVAVERQVMPAAVPHSHSISTREAPTPAVLARQLRAARGGHDGIEKRV